MSLSASELARYQRHLSLREIGLAGQVKLKSARVLVVGAGGLGSPACLYLAASGIGTLGVVDCDRVELSNLQRQVLFDADSVGQRKTDAARARLALLNPEIAIVAHDIELRAANVGEILRDYDIVLDGTDRIATRYLVNDACVLLGKSLVSAAIHRFEGQAMTYVPGRGPCYRCLFPDTTEGAVPSCAEAGVLGVLPGVLGAIQATEAIKLITGVGEPLLGRLLTYDALEMRTHEFRFARRTDCAVCGDSPSITAPRDPAPPCGPEAMARIRSVSARELLELLSGVRDVQLVDVREPREFSAGHLRGAVNIPLATLERRLSEVTREGTAVFMCSSGRRSSRACAIAARNGVETLVNLEDGLLGWQRDVDPKLVVAPSG